MRKYFAAILIALTVVTAAPASSAVARKAPETTRCDSANKAYYKDTGANHANTVRMAKCLAKQPALRVSWSVAKRVAACESGWYDRATSSSGTYRGIYQLGAAEFKSFPHQAKASWVNWEFRHNNWFRPAAIYDARANIIAAYAHAHHYGWSAWSCY